VAIRRPKVGQALSASLEDYLEAVLALVKRGEGAHVKDIADRLRVTKPSVTGALRNLAKKKLVRYRPYETVTLTRQGEEVAEQITMRHKVFTTFFQDVLGLDSKVADETACKMEHVVDEVVLERLAAYIHFAKECPLEAAKWEGGFGKYCEQGGRVGNCERRLENVLAKIHSEKGQSHMDALTLDRMKPGQRAKILKVRAASGATNRRLVDMGVTRGTIVEVERVAPLGDPMEVKVKGYHLSLRKEEARGISVEPRLESDKK